MNQKCARPMGITFSHFACWRKKNRFQFYIGDNGLDKPAVADEGVSALPPTKGARPSLTFKETECQHLNETIFFPSKPDWKPISLVLYDIQTNNPVFDWIKKVYNPSPTGQSSWRASCNTNFKKTARLEIYDGCGRLIERWVYENAWPQVAEWGDLDMSSSEVITVDLTLRYDRAYILSFAGDGDGQNNPNDPHEINESNGFNSGGLGGNQGPGGSGGQGPGGVTGFGPGPKPGIGLLGIGGGGPTFGSVTIPGGVIVVGGNNSGVPTVGTPTPGGTVTLMIPGTGPVTEPSVTYQKIGGKLVPVIQGGMVPYPSRNRYPPLRPILQSF